MRDDTRPPADFASAVGWLGYCGICGDPSPEVRDSEAAALRDAAECWCKQDDDPARTRSNDPEGGNLMSADSAMHGGTEDTRFDTERALRAERDELREAVNGLLRVIDGKVSETDAVTDIKYARRLVPAARTGGSDE